MEAGGASGAALERREAEAARLLAILGRGAVRVAPEALQPADMLLDLYGEDIRARAFVTRDEGGERMLRPDFTVPVLAMHMAMQARKGGAARYVYCGPVWRRQEAGSGRAAEYLQAGVELIGAADAAEADAEVFALIAEAVGPGAEPATGDLGLVFAAIAALPTSEVRKAALRRHVWRPDAFRRRLERFGPRHGEVAARRAALIADWRAGRLDERIAEAGAAVGLRTAEEIARRAERLAAEAETPPLSPDAVAGLEAVMAVRGSAAEALARYRELARAMPALEPAADRLAARLAALGRAGHPPGDLPFEASFGRTTLEYYDGFVFGFRARGQDDLPPLASGGRYDALARLLTGGEVAAVGGIVRPEALIAAGGGA